MKVKVIKDFERFVNIMTIVVEYTKAKLDSSGPPDVELIKYLIEDGVSGLVEHSDFKAPASKLIKNVESGHGLDGMVEPIAEASGTVTRLIVASEQQYNWAFQAIKKADVLVSNIHLYSEKFPNSFANILSVSTTSATENVESVGDTAQNQGTTKAEGGGVFTKIKEMALEGASKARASGDFAEATEEAVKALVNPVGIGTIISGIKAVRKTVDAVVDIATSADGEQKKDSSKADGDLSEEPEPARELDKGPIADHHEL